MHDPLVPSYNGLSNSVAELTGQLAQTLILTRAGFDHDKDKTKLPIPLEVFGHDL